MNELFISVGCFIFVIGLCIGSFLNVVVLRAFSGESVVFPASKCPKCQKPLKPYDNIPVLSYLLLRGKCRYCKEPISIQYPVVELFTGLGFLALFLITKDTIFHPGATLREILFLPWILTVFSLATVIAVTDIKQNAVFDVHSISLAVIILIYKISFGMWVDALTGLAAGIVGMEFLNLLGRVLSKKRAFGVGDTFICASIGALVGVKPFIYALLTAVIIQFLFTVPIFVFRFFKNKEYTVLTCFGGFILFAILTKMFPYSPYSVIFTVITAVFGICFCTKLSSSEAFLKNPLYLPFGPALLASMFIVFFWGNHIVNFFSKFLNL